MNKPVRRIAIFCGLLVLALMIRGNWLQFVKADELKNDKNNMRVNIARYSQPRGNIIVDGQEITGSKEVNGINYKYKRTYKNGEMWAPVTGYSSQVYKPTLLEGVEDKILTGDDDRLFFNRTIDMITGKGKKGGDVITTLNAKAQEAAFKGLGSKKGAVAAIDPRTGKILALASTPSYDPSRIAGANDGDAWTKLNDDKNKPMLNRALRETYPPGSTFKVVTAAAALENGLYKDVDEKTNSPKGWTLPDTRNLPLPNETPMPCDNVSMRAALQWSCNSVFGKISADLGNQKMIEQANKFGYNNDDLQIPVGVSKSVYPKDNRPQNAMAGIGQASNRATPLQMAMVAAAVANNGKLMEPYMVDKLRAPNLNVIETHQPKELSRPLSPEHAQTLQSAMETVVEEGTGTEAKIDGVKVGGKTGTAQHGVDNSGNPYAWFISYAKKGDGSPVAVAVVIEGSNTMRDDIAGGKLAAPIAKGVMEAVLNSSK
ncbi:penicillin-binding protein 2 [Streptomyces mobaraensis NBRC 13819 = DSM 40847]|uniref:Penicillin-binding protein 2 n=2 Tax=Streptomyces mobaraensis TaxID=35621 RepID=A0A5N5WAX7_STRMB|nr:penicillin-binding transpeptidase domain-containing protein [Streptomyces mobaraensis]EMF01818.1 penicillin-binding protein transpeptidase [Streptomyces mobaraensis NBRC 13819 = DSM 40847]KAB7848407.1 penicillin-binding protein 2 [Streptomyces mobaraensis]QTT74673.1 penicillin-binding protein 2 [Streptomyces mobaraensis NBRC 13819 = DSM 40847]